MASEFATPGRERLPLAGDSRWIDIKRELNAGEQRHAFAGLVKEFHAGERAVLDPEKLGITKVLTYLLGWSFTDTDGNPVPVSPSAVDNLKPATYAEIAAAIDAYEERQAAALEARKNDPATGSPSSATSLSAGT